MKKAIIFIVLISILFTLTGCIKIEIVSPTEATTPTQAPTEQPKTDESVETKYYPCKSDYHFPYDETYLVSPIVSPGLFSSDTDDEYFGKVFSIFGTVVKIDTDEENNSTFTIDTTYGYVTVSDISRSVASSFVDDGFSVDMNKLDKYFPLPEEGEFMVMFAEHSGYSSVFNTPYFIYTSEDYLSDTLAKISKYQ